MERLDQLKAEHPDKIYVVNGNKRNLIIGLSAIFAPMAFSIVTFWFGFYPQIADKNYVKDAVGKAPWTKDKPLVLYRMDKQEEQTEKILAILEEIRRDIQERKHSKLSTL